MATRNGLSKQNLFISFRECSRWIGTRKNRSSQYTPVFGTLCPKTRHCIYFSCEYIKSAQKVDVRVGVCLATVLFRPVMSLERT